MSLQDVDDAAAALREAARVLDSDGRVAIAIVHPFWSARTVGEYFVTKRYDVVVERAGVQITFASLHRPLGAWVDLLRDAGLVIENLREPRPSEKHVAERPRWAEEARTPGVLHLLCGKP